MEKKVWLVNKSSESIYKCILELKKHIDFEPGRPVPMEKHLALRYATHDLRITDKPEKYFTDRKMQHLVMRDAGIGDLLLLEPVLVQLSKENREVSAASRYPAVYQNNPHIKDNILMTEKSDMSCVNLEKYEAYDDLRNYSETCQNRETKHRTDCYNQKFNLEISDKEPKLYFDKEEKSILKRKKDKIYIGIQANASHDLRRYERGVELVEYLLNENRDYQIVLLGHDKYVDYRKTKRVIDLQGDTTIREAINVIRDLDYMICADSGLMHIALTLHVPTVCMFGIIHPKLRLEYYTGQYKVVDKALSCMGCGSHHAAVCTFGNKKQNVGFKPPCMDIDPEQIFSAMSEMELVKEKRVFFDNVVEMPVKTEINKINIVKSSALLTMPVIVQNESHNLPRFIENVINHKNIGRVIAIDGGSEDNTVELLEKAGAEVHVHPYIKTYHDQQAMQRNISCSYVKDGEKILIMDIDECFSQELSDYLEELAHSNIEYGLISRKTFNYYDDITDPTKAIKDYPDYQPRFYKWNRAMKFVGGAHHITLNCPQPTQIKKDIIHFEKEGKDRDQLESQWANMMQGVKRYGN